MPSPDATADAGEPPDEGERKITLLDVLMISLAVVSIGLLIFEEAYPVGDETRRRIILADLVIVGIFALEFLWRLSRAKRKLAYVKSHWYDLVGMVPVSHPLFRGFRLARILRLVVLAGRFVRATNRTFGEAVTERFVGKYRDIIVDGISDRIVLKVLDETEDVLARGAYGTATARALDANREALLARVNAQLKKEGATRLAMSIPGVERLVENVQERTVRAVVATLGSREMDETIVAVIREIVGDLRREVQAKQWRPESDPDVPAAGAAPA